MESGYYPPGAENDPNAPYNQSDPETEIKEFEVTITLTKTIPIEVTSDLDSSDQRDEAMEYIKTEVCLPHELATFVEKDRVTKHFIEDSSDWELTEIDID